MKKLLYLFLCISINSIAFGATYTVTQSGIGADYSISEFNALSGTRYAGDTFYFSGTFSSQVYPQISGTSGNPVILDGWSGGSYNATDGNHTNLASLSKMTYNSGEKGMIWIYGTDYITVQDFNFDGQGSSITGIGVTDTSGGDDSEGLTVKDCYFHDIVGRSLWAYSYSGGGGKAVRYVTFGGASGDGNEVYNVAGGDVYHMFRSSESEEFIISYNKFHNNDSTRKYGSGGITVGANLTSNEKFLIEYNYVAGNNYRTSSGEVGIGGKSGRYFIIRFNKVENNIDKSQGRGISSSYNSQYKYVYGNWITANFAGTDAATGSGFRNSDGIDVDYIYIFSNVVFNHIDTGVKLLSWDGSDYINHIWVFNNTIFGNATSTNWDHSTGLNIYGNAYYINVSNNILEDNRPNDGGTYRQMYVTSSYNKATYLTFQNNKFYDPDGKATVYWGSSRDLTASSVGTNNTIGNPGLKDPHNGDFEIGDGAAVIGAGVDMGSGAIATITIMGNSYPVYWDIALAPGTDFSGTDPTRWTVNTSHRDTVGWDIGAYAFGEGSIAIAPPRSLTIR